MTWHTRNTSNTVACLDKIHRAIESLPGLVVVVLSSGLGVNRRDSKRILESLFSYSFNLYTSVIVPIIR